ncbi:MAG: SLC13 family permease [Planctomycetota bacterium]
MGIEAWITVSVVGLLVAALISGRIGTDTAVLGALTLLMAFGVVTPERALGGFADTSVLMIAALFVVASGLTETGAMEQIAAKVLGRPRGERSAQLRLMLPVAAMSAFMNNTPIVAMYLPIVRSYARKLGVSPSRLYMPLAFAAILGGSCTLIGTSTNIAVMGLWLKEAESIGAALPSPVTQFWAVAVVGLPATLLGTAVVLIFGRALLPARIAPDEAGAEGRAYSTAAVVEPGGPVDGKTIEQAGLRRLPGLFLYGIERAGDAGPERLNAVGPEQVLRGNDRLLFSGVVDSVVDLLKQRGLNPDDADQVQKLGLPDGARRVVEAVVSPRSPLIKRTVRESNFRARFNAAILAIHRGGQRLEGRIGDIVFQPGDTLLLATHHDFPKAHRNSNHFLLVSGIEGSRPVRHRKAWLAVAIMGLLVTLFTIPLGSIAASINQTTGWALPTGRIPTVVAAWVCAMLMVFTRCTTGTAARNSMSWDILLVIAGAIGIGRAMDDTGAARAIADAFFAVAGGLGPRALLFAFALLTMVISQLVTNKAAAVLLFPIAIVVAQDAGCDPFPFVVTLMAATACSFLTPLGFVVNLMVYGPGGYRFTDYLRLGIPLSLIVAALCAVAVPAVFPLEAVSPSVELSPTP